MDLPCSPRFSAAGAVLAGAPGLALEWSLRIEGGGASVRDRVIAWIAPHSRSERTDAYRQMAALLVRLGAPLAVRLEQWRLSGVSISQGIGLSVGSDEGDLCLYIAADSPAGTRYLSFRWHDGGDVEHARYSCHALPATSAGIVPAACVHPALQTACSLATAGETLRRQAAFWLRRQAGQLDRASLEYRWQPPLARVAELLGASFPALAADPVFACYRHHHFRHLAFNGAAAAAPVATVSFRAPWRAPWPTSVRQLHEGVRHAAGAAHRMIESRTAAGNVAASGTALCN